jgi:subtilase family protein
MQKRLRIPSYFGLGMLVLLLTAGALAADNGQRYLIQCTSDCSALAASLGRTPGAAVEYQFKNVPGLVATLPLSAVATLEARQDVVGLAKEQAVPPPVPAEQQPLTADGAQVLAASALPGLVGGLPADYNFNNGLIGASTLHAQGTLGNVVVAIIDSGTANNPTVVSSLAGSVIGGESFVPAAEDPVLSATSTHNGPHGTWVGTVIASHVIFLFPVSSTLVRSLQAHAPDSVIPCSALGCPATLAGVPMIGVAPAAKLYALKVFNSAGGSASNIRIAAAMDRAITLRKNFNNGVPSVPTNPGCGGENSPCVYDSLPIQVVNMSLGGLTLYAGRDLEAQLTTEMLKAGITITVAAGNSGPGALTTESPGSGPGALSAGAAMTPQHARILGDLQLGFGAGNLLFPFNAIQTASFSSRGPSADGRFSVDVSSNGFANFCQGANGGLSLVSGTSFASPTAAGAAALLREKFSAASAVQVRSALIAGANPNLLGDGSGRIDQGSGFLDVPAAAAKLAAGAVSGALPETGLSNWQVDVNIHLLGIDEVRFDHNGQFTQHVAYLLPGQAAQFYVPTSPDTESLTVSVNNLTPSLPPSQQNQLFGDDLFLTVLDAPTSAAVTLDGEFVDFDTTRTFFQPQSGIVRVTLLGSPNNAGPVSADLVLQNNVVNQGPPTAVNTVKQGEDDIVRLQVPPGASQLTFQLSFKHDWGAYPTDDVDLIIVDPNGTPNFAGATLNSPERVVVQNPVAGTWTAHVVGFQINKGVTDLWKLLVRADGQPVPRVP